MRIKSNLHGKGYADFGLRNLSIEQKILTIIMIATSIAVLVAGVTSIAYQMHTFRHKMVVDLTTHAQIIADNCLAALTFDDPDDANKILSSLRAKPAIVYACVNKKNHILFTAYRRPDFNQKPERMLQPSGHRFDKRWLVVSHPVIFNHEPIGNVMIQSDLTELRGFLTQSILAFGIIMAAVLLLAFGLSFRLHRVITAPILHLRKAAAAVSQDEDYAVRVIKHGEDELGKLTDAFNNMLEQIEKRDYALRKSEEWSHAIADYSYDWETWCGTDGKILWVNPAVTRITGYSIDECLAMDDYPLPIVHEKDREEMGRKFREVLKDKTSGNDFPFRIRKKNGEIRWIAASWQSIYDSEEGWLGVRASARDVTDRMLVESERIRLTAILEATPDLVSLTNPDHDIIYMNRSGRKLIGWTDTESLEGKTIPVVHPAWAYNVIKSQGIPEAIRNGIWKGETALIDPDGSEIQVFQFIMSHKSPSGEVEFISTIMRDITEQKRYAQQISDALEFNEKIISNSPVGISIYDESGQCTRTNDAMANIIGPTRDELLSQNFYQLESWKISGLLEKATSAIAENKKMRHELKVKSTFGKMVSLDCHVVPFIFEGKARLLLMVNDISERIKAEEETRHLRNYLKNIIDSMPSVLIGLDQEENVTHWNLEAEKLSGIPAKRAEGRKLVELHPGIYKKMDKIWSAIRERKVTKEEKVPVERNGEIRYTDVTIYPLVANGIEGTVIRVDDVTEKVRIEEMMIQSEKMLSVGGLAAGMAHEINNPLAGILQNIQVILNRVKRGLHKNREVAELCGTTMEAIEAYMEKREIYKMIQLVMDSGKRAAQIVENMLTFSRKSDSQFAAQDICKLLDKTIELASSEYDLKKRYDFRKIKIIREYDADMPKINCDGSKLQQVFLNVLKNGAQALADKLTDGFKTGDGGNREAPHFILRVKAEDDMVRIEIEDNGPGMNEETRRRVFEPFFTTKGVGVGTGLGLSVSYFIITDNHNGKMTVESEPGLGTKFIIRLPVDRNKVVTPDEVVKI